MEPNITFNLTSFVQSSAVGTCRTITQKQVVDLVSSIAQQMYGLYWFFPLAASLVTLGMLYYGYNVLPRFYVDDSFAKHRALMIAGLMIQWMLAVLFWYYSPMNPWLHVSATLPFCRP